MAFLDPKAREDECVEIHLRNSPTKQPGWDLDIATGLYSAGVMRGLLEEAARQSKCPESYLQLTEYCDDEGADYGCDQGVLVRFSKDEFDGMTVAEYKAKFGLPHDYPTTSSDYSERRSAMAKSLGLGRQVKAIEAKPE